MTEFRTILPSTSTGLELSLDELAHEIIDTVDAPLRQLNRPYEVAEDLLPWLAWGEDTKVWLEEWGPEKRRDVIVSEPFRKAKLGTAWAMREYVRIAGSEVLRVTVPPASFYWGPGEDDLIAKWKTTLAQLRVYPYMQRGPGYGFHYNEDFYPGAGEPDPGYGLPWGNPPGTITPEEISQYFLPDTGLVYRQRQAFLWVAGNMIQLPWASNYEYFAPAGAQEMWAIPHLAAPGDMFWDEQGYWGDWLSTDLVDVYSVTLRRAGQQEYLRSGTKVTSIQPEFISEPFPDNPALILDNDYWDYDFLLPEDGYSRYYERYHVYRPGVNLDHLDLGGYGYYNTSTMLYGIPPFTAEIMVDTSRTMPVAAIVDDWTGFWLPENTVKFDRAVEALRVSKAARDTVFANPNAHRQMTLGDRPTLPFRLGSYVET